MSIFADYEYPTAAELNALFAQYVRSADLANILAVETLARSAADQLETAQRQAADILEAANRSTADNTEAVTRGAAIAAEAATRAAAIVALQGLPSIASLQANAITHAALGPVYVHGYTSPADGGEGAFLRATGDTVSTDNGGTIIVDALGQRWYRAAAKVTTPFQFGAVGDGSTDDTAALQNWLNWLQSLGSLTEGAAGAGVCPAGFKFLTSKPLLISTPINMAFNSWIYYTGTTGSAVVIGAVAPVNGRNTGYKLYFAGLRAVNGNTAAPTSVNTSGSVGVEVRNMQFSRLQIDELIAFTYVGLFCNSSNNVYSGQQDQDNSIWLGQIAYNGYGCLALSHGAADGSVQANDFHIQNIYGNWTNLQLDNAVFNSNTNNNTFDINAMDADTGGGACYIYGSFNTLMFAYLDGAVACESTAFNNRVIVANPFGSGAVFAYNTSTGNGNWLATTAPPAGNLPNSFTLTSGTPTQNTFGVPVSINFSATLTPTSSAGETCAVFLGQTQAQMVSITGAAVTQDANPQAIVFPFSILVPPGWWWSVALSGSGTGVLSNAYGYQAG